MGTSTAGSQDRLPAPTAATSLLTNAQLVKIVGDPKLLAYAEQQLQDRQDISHQLEPMEPPSATGSSSSQPAGSSSGGATDPSSNAVGSSSDPLTWSSPSGSGSSSSESASSTPSGTVSSR